MSEPGAESAEEGNRKGRMPPTNAIPEPPRHRLYITGEDGHTLRFVDSDHPDVWGGSAHREYAIVRCGICGHEASDWGAMRGHVWSSHEMHVSSRHVGAKVVWRAEDVADVTLADLEEMSRRRHLRRDAGPEHITAYRGDTSMERVRELVADEEPVVVVHIPASEPYPGSIEEGATEAFYVA